MLSMFTSILILLCFLKINMNTVKQIINTRGINQQTIDEIRNL